MPRTYRLGERAATMDATRLRIIDAAVELYAERGISATTMQAIGARADVAPGTLRKHFPSRDHLDRAMVERLRTAGPLPALSIFDGAESLEDRLIALFRAAAVFFDAAAPLYRMWLRERLLTGPWLEAGVEYGDRWRSLMRLALGPLADDEQATAALRAVLHPTFFEGIRAGRRSTDEVAALVAAVVTPWFVSRTEVVAGSDGAQDETGTRPGD